MTSGRDKPERKCVTMPTDHIPPQRLWAWLLAAVSAPLAHYSGGGWLAVALAAGAMLPLSMMFRDGWSRMGPFAALAQFVWLTVVAGYLAQYSAEYWPSDKNVWVVPVTLLALGTLSAGAEKAPRAGSAVAWLVMLTALPILLAALSQIRVERLTPCRADWQAGLLVTLLIPALGSVWNRTGEGGFAARAGVGVLAVGLAALTQGVLSCFAAQSVQTPFFEMTKTLNLFGGRWEVLGAAAMTLGWYALCNFLIATASVFGATAGIPKKYCPCLAFLGSAAFVILRVQLNETVLTVFTLILWVLMPMLHEKIPSKKDEKSA